ncbi:MAG: glycosyltransferase family 2 protein [Muribaculaceae bacterium]|nr:glycosyltransferase family 2 protein [Muribaculaceae bacterium]
MGVSRLISIVIPVYNAGGYLAVCLDSVMAQTYSDIEVIVVDDGSTDNSGRICDEYASRDSRVKVLHRSNGGPSVARNAALDEISGGYVTFVDADDKIHPRYIETLYRNMDDYGADISSVGLTTSDGSMISGMCKRNVCHVYSSGEAMELILFQRILDNAVSGKLYRKSLWDDVRFRDGIYYEDLEVFYHVYRNAGRVVHMDVPMYYYRQHKVSRMGNFVLGRADVLNVTDEILEYVSKEYPSLTAAARDRKFSANMNILWLMSTTGISDDATVLRCWRNIRELRMSSLLNPKVRMKNKIGALTSFGGLWLLRNVFRLFKA